MSRTLARSVALGLTLSLAALAPVRAQSATSSTADGPLPLARVRLTLPSETVVGTVLTVSPDSALLQTAGPRDGELALSQRWVSLGCVDRAALSMGPGPRWRSTLMYAVFGAVGGAALGATAGGVMQGAKQNAVDSGMGAPGPANTKHQRVVQFSIGGAVVGAIIGYRNPRERWQPLPGSELGVRRGANCGA